MTRSPFPAPSAILSLLVLFLLFSPACRAQVAEPPAGLRYDFYSHGPYRNSVPRPSAVLGYEAGETHSTFRSQERAILAIAAAARDRVRVLDYGVSSEGRPLRLIIVTSPQNLARLDAIRADNAKLADPRLLTNAEEGERLIHTAPAITWINHCIHGDESASFESAMWTLYTLAASNAPAIQDVLQHSVVILNPVFNPDGHERFVVYNNSIAVGSPEDFAYEHGQPWAISGRFNHYRFDMNRDKLAQSQSETRQETAIFLKWHPHVFVDQHGQPDTYFFPPNSLPQNRQVDRNRINKWTEIFGRANAHAFDRYGWRYVTHETFDFFYPGYLDSFTTLSGAIGMTYETDGGGSLARRRSDETISTLRDATAHHCESALATIVAAAQNRETLLRDFLAYRQDAIATGRTEKIRRIVISPDADPGRAAELAGLLLRVGVEVRQTQSAFTSANAHAYLPPAEAANPKSKIQNQKSQTFPAGSLIVDLAQPQGRVARAFLEPDNDFEPEFVKEQLARRDKNNRRNERENREEYDFYDITAWSLPYSFGLTTYWTEDAPDVAAKSLTLDAQGQAVLAQPPAAPLPRATVAYAIRYNRDAAAYSALQLLQANYRLAVVTKPIKANGKTWGRGTLIAFVSRNPAGLYARLAKIAATAGVEIEALDGGYGDELSGGLGSGYVAALRKPKVAVIEDDMVSQTGFGAVWHLFERVVGLKFTPLRLNRLASADLSRFNVIVLPEGYGYAGSLGKGGIDRLKEWIGQGNVLIGLGPGGQWFTDKEAGISSAVPVSDDPEKDAALKPEERAKKRPTDLPGAIFRAQIDPEHFLGYGYPQGEIVVPLGGATFLKPSKQGSNVVTFGKGPSRLSGFIWPGNTEELLAGTAYVIDEPIGSGHALLYLQDPTFRALWPGLRRLFLSGILFGPARMALEPPGE